MSRAEPFLLTVVFAVFVLVYGALPWLAGGLYLDTHEGDSYHLLDILTRMADGDIPHVDFMTPLGVLAFWPVTVVMETGYSAGRALILAQFGVAVVLLPVVAYAALTRLGRGLAVYFGLTTLGLVMTLSYGTPGSGVGISMHYNRWAWSIAFLLLLLSLVPAKARPRPLVDGALIGVLAAALLLLKITYFVALVPVILLLLWSMHGPKGVVAAGVGGLAVAAIVTAGYGISFWFAYFADLRLVAGNEVRPFVGVPFNQIVAGPSHIVATLLGVLAVLVLRPKLSAIAGVAVLLLLPAFLYITYQNFGNDPQWLLFLPVMVLAFTTTSEDGRVLGMDAARVSTWTAVAAFAVFFPSLFNMSLSPIKHLSFDKSRFIPMVPEAVGHQDIYIRRDRAYTMTAQVFQDQAPGPWAKYAAEISRPPVTVFEGVTFPSCEWMAGSRAMLETLGNDLTAAGLEPGSRLFTADLLATYWFFAPVSPPEGGAPWYYGGVSGLDNADYVLVPKCAFTSRVRNVILRDLAKSGAEFSLVRDNDLMALFRVETD